MDTRLTGYHVTRDPQGRSEALGWRPYGSQVLAREPNLGVPTDRVRPSLARCLQHETDHTLGTVFGDRLSAKSRKKLGKKHDAAAEDYPLTGPAS